MPFNSSLPPKVYVFAASAVPSSVTGTSAQTALASIPTPAAILGMNGALRITTLWTITSNTNTKTLGVSWGGVSFLSVAIASGNSFQSQVIIRNRGSLTSQVGFNSGSSSSFANSSGANTTGSVNTAAAQTLVITGQLGVSTDTITLESYLVEVLNP